MTGKKVEETREGERQGREREGGERGGREGEGGEEGGRERGGGERGGRERKGRGERRERKEGERGGREREGREGGRERGGREREPEKYIHCTCKTGEGNCHKRKNKIAHFDSFVPRATYNSSVVKLYTRYAYGAYFYLTPTRLLPLTL